jgi:hypothetical protein
MQTPSDERLAEEMGRRGPPVDVSAGALFRKFLETPAPSEVFDFPRRGVDAKVRMMVLPLDEHHNARLRGEEWLAQRKVSKDAKAGAASREVLADRIAQEVIALSACSEKPIEGSEATGALRYIRWFATPEDVGKLSADEVNALMSAYVLTQHRYGPHYTGLPDDAERTAWIQRLTEGASANPLVGVALPELATLTLGLARRAYSLSAILASLQSTLPDTLKSLLEDWGIGTSSRGWPAVDSTVTQALGLPPKDDDAPDEPVADLPPVLSPIPLEPLTMAQALELAKELRKD